MTRLSERQQLDLAVVAAADQRWRDAKHTVETEVRREIDLRTQHLLEARNDAALLARENGSPGSQIAYIGLHTKSTLATREAIAEARERRRLRDEAQPPRFRRGERPDEILVQLHGAELDAACRAVGWTVDDAMKARVTSAVFRTWAVGADQVAVALTESQVAERPHPIVVWGRSHSAEILEWNRLVPTR